MLLDCGRQWHRIALSGGLAVLRFGEVLRLFRVRQRVLDFRNILGGLIAHHHVVHVLVEHQLVFLQQFRAVLRRLLQGHLFRPFVRLAGRNHLGNGRNRYVAVDGLFDGLFDLIGDRLICIGGRGTCGDRRCDILVGGAFNRFVLALCQAHQCTLQQIHVVLSAAAGDPLHSFQPAVSSQLNRSAVRHILNG